MPGHGKPTQIQIGKSYEVPPQIQLVFRTGTAQQLLTATFRDTFKEAAHCTTDGLSGGNVKIFANNWYFAETPHGPCVPDGINAVQSSAEDVESDCSCRTESERTQGPRALCPFVYNVYIYGRTESSCTEKDKWKKCLGLGRDERPVIPRGGKESREVGFPQQYLALFIFSTTEVYGTLRDHRYGHLHKLCVERAELTHAAQFFVNLASEHQQAFLEKCCLRMVFITLVWCAY